MRKLMLGVGVVTAAFVLDRLSAQDFQPSCEMCPSTYVSAEELQEYEQVASAGGVGDQQIRSIDLGKTNVAVALVRRGPTRTPRGARPVAEHDLVSEVYCIMSGSGTNVTGPDLVGRQPRAADNRAVRLLNGPGGNAAEIRNGATHQLKPGDVLVIPAGTGHTFTKIDDHITYLNIRVDPDQVVPLMDEAASRAYLADRRR